MFMREFIYYSKNAVTNGNFDLTNLMKAGRMDIACNIVIMSFFVSHNMRYDVRLHLIFDGAPDPPKHIEMFPEKNLESVEGKVDISKKDVAGLLKKMLYKYKKGIKNEVFPGYWIEKKSFSNLIGELSEQGKQIYILDKKGEDIRNVKLTGKEVFILGDQDGIPKQELKRIKNLEIKKVSVGPYMYFASQALTILQNEIDRQETC
ncbi:MAG: tRNA (pseudouridine(54)-N(1))-methyltransferase TrmY [Nanoarchaeota archaeon]